MVLRVTHSLLLCGRPYRVSSLVRAMQALFGSIILPTSPLNSVFSFSMLLFWSEEEFCKGWFSFDNAFILLLSRRQYNSARYSGQKLTTKAKQEEGMNDMRLSDKYIGRPRSWDERMIWPGGRFSKDSVIQLSGPKSNSWSHDPLAVKNCTFNVFQMQEKFQSWKSVLIEDTEGFTSPEKFRDILETGPKCVWLYYSYLFFHITEFEAKCHGQLHSEIKWHRRWYPWKEENKKRETS